MKTIKYLLIPALTGLLFTACNTEVKGPSQAELDTQVEAKLKSAVDQLKADCDSRIMQAAQAQADSMLAKAGKTAPASKQSAPAAKKTEKPKPAPVKTNPKADRFNNNGGKTVTKEDTKQKEARFENEGKKEVTPEDTKKKADRFKK